MTIHRTFYSWYDFQVQNAELSLRNSRDNVYIVFTKKETRMVIKWLKLREHSFNGYWNFGDGCNNNHLKMVHIDGVISYLESL